ncbi:hypothetical protein [Myxococcus sp. RHSTA-1-4]|uniref:2OG-Fe(II)-dependent halogenase WelO5 family protein n=1 Tax=Myxococcus sp. RHSTA-1-4 TaxID=2874601 RepID=UPI001CBC555F|nr:hypothetical protein [Myxococcus sp. RHSTA-1-4]MBZ4420719.1 hypothetical protein [Myxococcus sp. RHSTA-1-4]
MTQTAVWEKTQYYTPAEAPGPEVLKRLVRGEQSLAVFKGLLTPEELNTQRERIRAEFARAHTTRYVNGALTTIGPYLAKYLPNTVAPYFEEAAQTRELFERIGFDLGVLVRERLQKALGLRSFAPAREPDGRWYADSIVRIHANGVRNPLHNDNVMRDAAPSGLSLARLTHQLSCVVCIQECDTGGELYHYRKRWHPDDEVFKIKEGLGYDEKVVSGQPLNIFKPQTGDVYLLNPTYYHSIERVGGADRITLGFFIGLPGDSVEEAVIWS